MQGKQRIMKILIVDDILENRLLLEHILAPFGSCDLANDGEEAVVLFEEAIETKSLYDLVMLDIMMPNKDGQTTLKEMRAMERTYGVDGVQEASIFILTASDSGRDMLRAYFKGGCTDYMTKPVNRQQLLDKLKEYRLISD